MDELLSALLDKNMMESLDAEIKKELKREKEIYDDLIVNGDSVLVDHEGKTVFRGSRTKVMIKWLNSFKRKKNYKVFNVQYKDENNNLVLGNMVIE